MELTNQDREQITEICNYLFKDTNIQKTLFCDQNQNCHYHCSDDSKIFVYLSGEWGFPLVVYHWLEFMICHLPIAFKNIFAEFDLDQYIIWIKDNIIGKDPKNPIIYLYPLFQELSKTICEEVI